MQLTSCILYNKFFKLGYRIERLNSSIFVNTIEPLKSIFCKNDRELYLKLLSDLGYNFIYQ